MIIKRIAFTIIAFTGVYALVTLLLFLFKTTSINLNSPIDTNIFANYGSVVGGISAALLSLVSVLLIIHSIKEQEKTRILQNIEQRFFELLKFVRENSENALSKGKTGRKVFVEIKKEFNQLFNKIKIWYKVENTNGDVFKWKSDLINITYLIIFYGLDEAQYDFLKGHLRNIITNDRVWEDFKNYLLDPMTRTHKTTKEENIEKPKQSPKYLKYDGYQNILGHYFRHLFQTVKFINDQPIIDYKQKYEYIKILRAQLSTFEQVLFFYNSMSTIGMAWGKSEEITDENYKLITKYNLVKNINFELNQIIDVKEFYPRVIYEGQRKTTSREELERNYS